MAAGFPLFTDNHVRQQMVCWPQNHHQRLTDGDFISALEDLARDPLAFAYPIRYIKPEP